jgi:hypothetical protein
MRRCGHGSPAQTTTTESRGRCRAVRRSYARPPSPRAGRPPPEDPGSWTVKDDWPEDVPVTEAEIEVFEAWFGDLFDELFSTRH